MRTVDSGLLQSLCKLEGLITNWLSKLPLWAKVIQKHCESEVSFWSLCDCKYKLVETSSGRFKKDFGTGAEYVHIILKGLTGFHQQGPAGV